MNIMDQLAGAMHQLEVAGQIRTAIGQALTPEQQKAVSAKVASGPQSFIVWASTDAGRAAIRRLADEFVKDK